MSKKIYENFVGTLETVSNRELSLLEGVGTERFDCIKNDGFHVTN